MLGCQAVPCMLDHASWLLSCCSRAGHQAIASWGSSTLLLCLHAAELAHNGCVSEHQQILITWQSSSWSLL